MKEVFKEVFENVGRTVRHLFIVDHTGPTETGSWELPPIFYIVLIAIAIIIHQSFN